MLLSLYHVSSFNFPTSLIRALEHMYYLSKRKNILISLDALHI